MDEQATRQWLQQNVNRLTSFDLNKNNQIEEPEFDEALKTLKSWQDLLSKNEGGWKTFRNGEVQEGLEWPEVVANCVAAPMIFVGHEQSPYWLPFAIIFRGVRAGLPDEYEQSLAVSLFANEPTATDLAPIGLVCADCISKAKAISEVCDSFGEPSAEQLAAYDQELVLLQYLTEQKLRQRTLERDGKFVYGITRQINVQNRYVQISLTGTAYRPA